MIPVNEFRSVSSEPNPQFRVLKPWWDVLEEYLGIAMLMIGVFGCTLQLTQDKISCLPNRFPDLSGGERACAHVRSHRDNGSLWEFAITRRLSPSVVEVFGRKNGLDIHQYEFVNHFCYERAVHWYGKYFPYLVLVHSMVFMVASSFWFKFPGTSSKIELFVSILGKCFDSPWTTRAISEVSEEGMAAFRRNTMSESAVDNDDDRASLFRPSADSGPEQTSESLLDKKEGEQAKALFEKVRKFRTHVEAADLLYLMYVLQTALKVFKFALITVYSIALAPNIQIVVLCSVPPDLTGFTTFCCNHNKAHLFSKLAYTYISLVSAYGLLCIYCLHWLLRRPLKEYSFESVRLDTGINDIPDVKNDFAFLLHLSDQYDGLYAKRFAVFLSEVSESRLKQLHLNLEWPISRLRARLCRNASARLELPLLLLPSLPATVFQLREVESLRLEQIGSVTVPGSVAQLTALRELALIHSPARLQQAALGHLQGNLRVLRMALEGPVPVWVYGLTGLEELHLSGPAPVDSLRELRSLRVLTLRCHLAKLPACLADVSSRLLRLHVHNEGTRLTAFRALRKLGTLTALEMTGCGLEWIPSALFSLAQLQELDLRENRLAGVEEIASLQHCRRLTALRLGHNLISCLPAHISRLRALETLDASWNRIASLPPRLCFCPSLRHLDLSHNRLAALPAEVGVLQGLRFLSLSFNALESLPDELFSCRRLQVLALGHNHISVLSPRVGGLAQLQCLELTGNRLEALPAELALCPALEELIVEESLMELLPPHARERMSHRGAHDCHVPAL